MYNPSRRPLLSRNCPGLDRSRPTRRIRRSVPKRHRPKWLRRTRVRNTRAVPSRSLTCCRKRVRNSLLSKFRWLKSSMRVLQMGSLLLAFLKASHTRYLATVPGNRARSACGCTGLRRGPIRRRGNRNCMRRRRTGSVRGIVVGASRARRRFHEWYPDPIPG